MLYQVFLIFNIKFKIENGDIYGFGENNFGQLGDKSLNNISIPQKINFNLNIKRIKAGYNHSMILTCN